MKKILAVITTGAILASCSTSSKVTKSGVFFKRKYTGGMYLDIAKNKKNSAMREGNSSENSENPRIREYKSVSENYLGVQKSAENIIVNTNAVAVDENKETALNNIIISGKTKFTTIISNEQHVNKIGGQAKKEYQEQISLFKGTKKDAKKSLVSGIKTDEKSLLKYAIIALAVSVLFWILGWATWIWPFFWVSYLAGVVAVVFFVLWLLKILDAI
ncbi:MAG: hypothetical protein KatS3mg028_0847 [Bacteroidia bacterium]|nr:MAG: hypothetical protein KatS3mg028_0847 [Bacteroidia bacterium]